MTHDQMREVIEGLLRRRKEWFTTGELGRAANISRQAALKHVNKLVQSGELESFGARADRHYGAGPGWDRGHGAVWRGHERTWFWADIGKYVPKLAYIDLGSSLGHAITRRSQMRSVGHDLDRFQWVVIDCWCVERMSEAAAHELFVHIVYECNLIYVEPINMTPEVAAVVHRVMRVDRR